MILLRDLVVTRSRVGICQTLLLFRKQSSQLKDIAERIEAFDWAGLCSDLGLVSKVAAAQCLRTSAHSGSWYPGFNISSRLMVA